MPGLRECLSLGGAVRADHRLVQEGHRPSGSAGADAGLVSALDALPPDAVRAADALGTSAAVAPAEVAAGRRGAMVQQADAVGAAPHAGDRTATATALRHAT